MSRKADLCHYGVFFARYLQPLSAPNERRKVPKPTGKNMTFAAARPRTTSGYKWTVLLVTTIGSFMAPLDGSIVTIAIPSIASSMMIGLETVVWISLAYLLVLTVLLINAGRLADLRGRKRIYITGFIIFTAGSALCGHPQQDFNSYFSGRCKASVQHSSQPTVQQS